MANAWNNSAGLKSRLAIDGTNSMINSLNCGGNRIINLQNPINGTDGVTKNYVDNRISDFLRTDGTNQMLAPLNAGINKINNVTDPTAPQDAATKNYVDLRTPLPVSRFQFPSATGPNTYTWKSIQEIPSTGFTEADFDNLPSGIYGCFTTYIPATRRGVLPVELKGYLTCYAYQNGPTVFNKRYTWVQNDNNTSQVFVSSIREGTWNTWVQQNPVLTNGVNSMTNSLNLDGNNIINVLNPANPQDAATKNYVDTSSILIDGSNSMTNSLNLNGNNIINVFDPLNDQDAATKSYVDNSTLSITGANAMTANLNLGNNLGINCLTPLAPTNIANKQYVDTAIAAVNNAISQITAASVPATITFASIGSIAVPTVETRNTFVLDPLVLNNPGQPLILRLVNDALQPIAPFTNIQIFKSGLYTISFQIDYQNTTTGVITVNNFLRNGATNVITIPPEVIPARQGGGGTFAAGNLNYSRSFTITVPVTPGYVLLQLFTSASAAGVNSVNRGGTILSEVSPVTVEYLPITGGIMKGNIDMNNSRIFGLQDPEQESEPANKNYVDNFFLGSTFEALVPTLSSNTSNPPFIASASSNNNIAWRAFANSTSVYYDSGVSPSASVTLNIQTFQEIYSGEFFIPVGLTNLTNVVLSGSINGTTFFPLTAPRSNLTAGGVYVFKVTQNLGQYIYYRFSFQALDGVSPCYIADANFSFPKYIAKSRTISEVKNPQNNQDAATKLYVDTAISSFLYIVNFELTSSPSSGTFLPLNNLRASGITFPEVFQRSTKNGAQNTGIDFILPSEYSLTIIVGYTAPETNPIGLYRLVGTTYQLRTPNLSNTSIIYNFNTPTDLTFAFGTPFGNGINTLTNPLSITAIAYVSGPMQPI